MATIIQQPPHHASVQSLALPAALLAVLAGILCLQTGILNPAPSDGLSYMPAMVTVPAGNFEHRLDGEYFKNGYAVDAPKVTIAMPQPIDIMKYQVTASDYDQCVEAMACRPREPGYRPDAVSGEPVPATGVSYEDAEAYAAWLSGHTGQTFTLPTDTEWAYAAGDAFVDDALGIDPDSQNPALRWLADYNRETARKASRDPAPKPLGRFGVNDKGLADIAGNVWEWTTTCQRRVELGSAAKAKSVETACGIYVVEGKHRSPMSSFVRDPKTGGCSVGAPPDNLGFRLVRRPGWTERLRQRIGL